MLVQPFGDWSVFQQIFVDHWEPFQRAPPRYQTAYYDGLVAKMLGCGNPEHMGYIAYRCPQCGQGQHVVSMRCQSSLCLRCAKVYVDNWGSQVSKVLPEGVISRHIILTVPAMFRTIFSQNAAVLVSALRRCGVQGLDDVSSAVKGKTLKGGSITVIHTPERDDSQRRLLAEVLARRCDALLLLTATPHDGHDRSFASLCALLDPSLVDGKARCGRPDVRAPGTRSDSPRKRASTPSGWREERAHAKHLS